MNSDPLFCETTGALYFASEPAWIERRAIKIAEEPGPSLPIAQSEAELVRNYGGEYSARVFNVTVSPVNRHKHQAE